MGTISLKSSILILPAGVSPILMSMNTIGRVVDDMLAIGESKLVASHVVVTCLRST